MPMCLPRPSRRFIASLLAAIALPAHAAIETPDCDTLADWATSLDRNDTYAVTPVMSLPTAMAADNLRALFGQPPLAWTREDVLTARGALNTCRQEARRAGETEQARTLSDANGLVARRLGGLVRNVGRARESVQRQAEAIRALPASPDLARAVSIMLAADPAEPRALRQALREVDRAVARPFDRLARALPNLPPSDRDELFATLAQRAGTTAPAQAKATAPTREAAADDPDTARPAEDTGAPDTAADAWQTADTTASGPCEAVGTWAESIDPEATYQVTLRHALPEALGDAHLEAVFGRPAPAWTEADIQAARQLINDCRGEARRAGEKQRAQALASANRVVSRDLRQLVRAAQRARETLAEPREAIAALPFSVDRVRATRTLLERDAADLRGNQAPLAGLDYEVQRQFIALARVLPDLPHAEREVLLDDLEEGFRDAEAKTLAGARERIDSAPRNAAGVLALERLRLELQALAAAGSPALGAVADDAGKRLTALRTALGNAAEPAWTPPSCEDLYAWAGRPDALEHVQVGAVAWRCAFVDERVEPLFGLPVPAWGDEHLALFSELADLCRARVDALADGSGQGRNPPADAPELVRLAAQGRWVQGGARELRAAREAMSARRDALAEVESLRERMAALPDERASLNELARLQRSPELGMLTPSERRVFGQEVETLRRNIATAVGAAMVAEMEAVEVHEPADLGRLWDFHASAVRRVPGQSRGSFDRRFAQQLAAAASGVLPAFRETVQAVPATEVGLASLGGLITEATGVPREGHARLPGYSEVVAERARAVAKTLAQRRCDALWASLELDADDAALAVWDGAAGTTLGALVCDLAEHGHAVSGFEPAGLLSDVSTLAVTLDGGVFQRISLHEGEVAPDTRMLVGFESRDANETRQLSVADWERFVARNASAEAGAVDCERIMNTPVDQLSVNDRMAAMSCVFRAALRELQAQ